MLIGVKRRRSAIKKLAEIDTYEVVQPLIEALEDEDVEVRRHAFLGLSGLKDSLARASLRERFLKSNNQVLWQIIQNNKMYPEELAERLSFLTRMGKTDDVVESVNEENFDEVLDQIIHMDAANVVEVLNLIIKKGGDKVEMRIVKKFIETGNDHLFKLIDRENWYPPDLKKKLMFLLKTHRYDKVLDMLDGVDFRRVLDILIDPSFVLGKYAIEALGELQSPIIMDEICQIYINEDIPQLEDLIMKNRWTPTTIKDRIFFYFKAPFLKGFFEEKKIDVDLLGGYMNIVHIRESMPKETLESLAEFLNMIVAGLGTQDPPEIPRDNPLDKTYNRACRYVDEYKEDQKIKEICYDYLKNPNPFLGRLLKRLGWAPKETADKVEFFIRSDQPEKVLELKETAVKSLFDFFKDEKIEKRFRDKAAQLLKHSDEPPVLTEVFKLYFKTFDADLDAIIKEKGWIPEKETDRALYYLYSGQIEKYKEIEKGEFDLLTEAYPELTLEQRFRLVDILIGNNLEHFIEFLISIFYVETNPRVLRTLCKLIEVMTGRVYGQIRSRVFHIDGPALDEIILTLTRIKSPESLELLYFIARLKKGFTCLWIIKLLEEAKWEPPESQKPLVGELTKIRDDLVRVLQLRMVDEDPLVRAHSAETFASLRDEQHLNFILKYVEDPDPRVGNSIASTLGQLFALYPEKANEQFNKFNIPSIFVIFNEVRKAFLVKTDEEQISTLARFFKTGTKIMRFFCLSAIERLRKKEAIPTLEAALGDEDQKIRLIALRTLKEITEPESQKLIYSFLDSDSFELRMTAAEALARIADEEMINRVAHRLTFNEFLHSDSLIEFLSLRCNPDFSEHFERAIRRADYERTAKHSSVVALARLSDQKSLHLLITQYNSMIAMDNKPEDLIPYVKAFRTIAHPSIYKFLEKLFQVGDWQVRKEVIAAMSDIDDRIALVAIIKALEDKNGHVQMAALDSLSNFFTRHFRVKNAEKDCKLLATIIARLKRLNVHHVEDKHHSEYKVIANLNATLMQDELTRMYLECKEMVS
jgi:HEAT repeat protein